MAFALGFTGHFAVAVYRFTLGGIHLAIVVAIHGAKHFFGTRFVRSHKFVTANHAVFIGIGIQHAVLFIIAMLFIAVFFAMVIGIRHAADTQSQNR